MARWKALTATEIDLLLSTTDLGQAAAELLTSTPPGMQLPIRQLPVNEYMRLTMTPGEEVRVYSRYTYTDPVTGDTTDGHFYDDFSGPKTSDDFIREIKDHAAQIVGARLDASPTTVPVSDLVVDIMPQWAFRA